MKTLSPLVSAWVGKGNFGDELLSYGLRLDLCRAAAISTITYYQPGAAAIFKADDEKIAIEKLSPGRLPVIGRWFSSAGHLSGFDSLFFGGGSVLHSVRSIERKAELLKKFRAARAKSQSIAGCFGVSLGPFDSVAAEHLMVKLLDELDFIVCRDRSSVEMARSLSSKAKVLHGCDLAFSVWENHRAIFRQEYVPNQVGASFILDGRKPESLQRELFSNMLAVVDGLTGAGCDVVLVSLYVGSKYEDDQLHEKLRGHAKHPGKIRVHHFSGDVFSTVATIARCNHFVSMRLHGAITAYLSSVPFLTLNKSPKVVDFCAEACEGSHVKTLLDISCSREELLGGVEQLLACPRRDDASDTHLRETWRRGFSCVQSTLV